MENPPGVPDYVLGRSESESRRLIKQSSFLQPFTERILRRSGLSPGMRVLDLGCGTGDVSFLAAELVGPTGSVLGIDRDPGVLAVARQRADAMGSTTVSFEKRSIEDLIAARPFDAVIGRFVLVYQPDPVSTLGHVSGLLRPGGIVAVLEPDMSVGVCSWPPVPLWDQVSHWIRETFRRGGLHYDIGARLYPLFRRAGLPGPAMGQDRLIGGGESMRTAYELCTDMIRSLLPRMEQYGIATVNEVQVDTLAERLERADHRRRQPDRLHACRGGLDLPSVTNTARSPGPHHPARARSVSRVEVPPAPQREEDDPEPAEHAPGSIDPAPLGAPPTARQEQDPSHRHRHADHRQRVNGVIGVEQEVTGRRPHEASELSARSRGPDGDIRLAIKSVAHRREPG